MPRADSTIEELAERGEALDERDIRARVQPEHRGKFLVIDIESGDYEIDDKVQAARE